jgi:hypothetical protein
MHSAVAALAAASAVVPAHAAVTQLLSPGDLTGTMATLGYSGVPGSEISTPLLLTGGGNTLTLTTPTGGLYFQTSDGLTFDFDAGTPLLETNAGGSFATNDGPLTISFADPVTEFGLSAEDAEPDMETFSFTVNSTLSGAQTFTLPTTDNISTTSGTAVLLGADAGTGNGFTSVTISSMSDRGSTNDFFVGPVTIAPAVPEASSAALLGIGTLTFLGSALLIRRHRSPTL